MTGFQRTFKLMEFFPDKNLPQNYSDSNLTLNNDFYFPLVQIRNTTMLQKCYFLGADHNQSL